MKQLELKEKQLIVSSRDQQTDLPATPTVFELLDALHLDLHRYAEKAGLRLATHNR
ncbi:hypothetical protein [Candidatus Cyanaurora vandensis]|uniref:hypothetical protein n=1 Tax=Candidatus Cyanaurora vandensis TaxID=2714958 RepID=UPI0025797778|nr:hypothetical protein [Candidatus Cyanaurora vandensis]